MVNSSNQEKYHILVHGDVVVDHHIYRGNCDHPQEGGCATKIIRQQGGAGLTADLLDYICINAPNLAEEGKPLVKVHDASPPLTPQSPPDPGMHHAYATWTTFPPTRNPDEKKSRKIWRVNETLGFGVVETAKVPGKTGNADTEIPNINIVVIDEGGLGFRSQKDQWPEILLDFPKSDPPWVVLKMSHPVCRGELWTHLVNGPFADRLIVLISADDMRRSRASVSKGLSWEKSVRELLGDLNYNAEFKSINNARHVIVNFGHDGALWVDNTDRSKPRRRLIFDPGHLEGIWEENLDGSILGAGACLLAHVVLSLFAREFPEGAEEGDPKVFTMTDGVDLGAGIARGLISRRDLLKSGHGSDEAKEPGFPFDTICEAMEAPRSGDLGSVTIPDFAIPSKPDASDKEDPRWTIIEGGASARKCPLYGRARKVVLDGEDALDNIPYGRFGKLYTVDNIELNGYYGLRKLMKDYVEEPKSNKPLCLGVFGPPGAGKSFGIKEIVKGVLDKKAPILTFNLAQFTQEEMLIGAFHQVRDEVLKGKVPVVFWDEFDSNDLKWLRLLLAPMNDGEFLEGQVTHPIGKSIFIFAGGTCDCMEEFSSITEVGQDTTFKDVKGPDFVSRLRGYLNVLGPNPRKVIRKSDSGETIKVADPDDIGFPIRRAIMLRVLAKQPRTGFWDIDQGLLNAMLKIKEFSHGARSMATIVDLTTGSGRRPFLRSNLPPREQLGLHVDYDEFMALIKENASFKLKHEELAPHIHQFYLDLAERDGWTPKYPMGWNDTEPEPLPESIKADNYAAARRLPEVLSLAGLVVAETDRGPGADPELVKKIIKENLDILAEAEHDGWMKFKLENGWKLDEIRDDDHFKHDALKPFKNLRPVDKDKDRDAVQNFPEIVDRAGFVIKLEMCPGHQDASDQDEDANKVEK